SPVAMAISPPETSAAPSAAATLSRKATSASVRVSMAVPVIAPLAWILMPSRPLCSLRSRARLRLRLRGLGFAVLGAGDAVGAERGLVDAQGAGDDDHRLTLGIPRPAVAVADTGRTGSRQAACRARDTPRLGAEARAEATARAGAARLGGEMAVTGHAQPGLHLGG